MATPDDRPTALVTGASYGIGRAISLGLAREGFDLIVSARSNDLLDQVRTEIEHAGGRVTVVAGDVTVDATRAAIINEADARLQGLKVFVNCASATSDPDQDADLETTADEAIDEMLLTTASAAMHLLKGLKSSLALASPSNAVFFASDWSLRGSHGPPVFSAAKAALLQFVRTSRREFARAGISLTTLVPGDVASFDADWQEPIWSLDDPVEEVRTALGENRIPLVDIVETVLFVCRRHMARVEEIHIAPLSPDYDY